ncbi:unnamed protein product [Dibothriocephalus latus]|uniref:G-protein coupled receptors family 1 profile domain-containing protein n=1 Tax=Dibothriocephalus latus TaxID=60516 RepID=A0A3P7NAK9_DIBLA|nr:unnamed protein product [Dibothriocephalus latus]
MPDGLQTSCSFDYLAANVKNYLYVAGMYTFEFLIPVGIVVVCYWQIVLIVRRNEREMASFTREANANKIRSMQIRGAQRRADVQAAKVSAIVVSVFVISWLPYATLAFLALNGYRSSLTPISAEVAVLFAKSSAVYNPLVYALMNTKFRASLSERMSCLIECCHCRRGQVVVAQSLSPSPC